MNIPGITDSNVEIFAVEYPKCMATYNGKKVGFWELPSSMISLARDVREKIRVKNRAGLTSWAVRMML